MALKNKPGNHSIRMMHWSQGYLEQSRYIASSSYPWQVNCLCVQRERPRSMNSFCPKLTYNPPDGRRQDHGSRLWGSCRVWQATSELLKIEGGKLRSLVSDESGCKMKLRGCFLVNGFQPSKGPQRTGCVSVSISLFISPYSNRGISLYMCLNLKKNTRTTQRVARSYTL